LDDILNLDGLKVTQVQEKDNDYYITVETTEKPDYCPHCGDITTNFIKNGTKKQLFMDLPIHAKRVGIMIKRQRYKCQSCFSTFVEELPMMDAHRNATVRLVDYISQQSMERTYASIAKDVGVDEKTVRNIFNEYVETLRNNNKFETPRWMGIDEIYIIKKPRGVIANIKENTLVDILPNRNKETMARYFMFLPGRKDVELVTMDMWLPYRDLVSIYMPQATVVVDKFHVTRMANNSLETIRKDTAKESKPKSTKKEKDEIVREWKRNRKLLLMRRDQINPFKDTEAHLTVQNWLADNPTLKEAYDLKEEFFEVYDFILREDALAAYQEWLYKVNNSSVKYAFKPLVTAMTNWETEIFNYFDCNRVTNAYTESLNNLIRTVNRAGRGYSFEALRAKMLYVAGAHKKATPKFDKQTYKDNMINNLLVSGYSQNYLQSDFGVEISTLVDLLEQDKF